MGTHVKTSVLKNRSVLIFVIFLTLLSLLAVGRTSNLFAASSDINVQVCSPNEGLYIVSPADDTDTRASSVIVSGYGAANVNVTAYRNGENVGSVTTGSDGSYSIRVPLVAGSNHIHTRVTNPCGHSTDSNSITVTRTTPPGATSTTQNPTVNQQDQSVTTAENEEADSGQPPTILEPSDGLVTDTPTILLKGRSDAGLRLWLERNGQRLAEMLADDQGDFAVTVPLVPGKNTIVVIAKTPQGEVRSEPIVVTYHPREAFTTSTSAPGTSLPGLPYLIPPLLLTLITGLVIGWHHHKRHLKKQELHNTGPFGAT